MQGAYIASSPHPVSQQVFMRELRRAVGMPVGLPAFSWMVRIGAPLFLRTDPELALFGRYLLPQRLLNDQFGFQFPQLPEAIRDILHKH
jgi:NAD dependent epimerase/dehydratase family enzyme